jgi:predicted transcriptional regulator
MFLSRIHEFKERSLESGERVVIMAGEGALRVLVAQVAAAYFSNSHVSPAEIPAVFGQITASLREVEDSGLAKPESVAPQALAAVDTSPVAEAKATAAEISRSIRDDGLISFEDGRSYKTLKRHLAAYGLTPAQYREKWGLADDYPMVCATSSAKRSALAKQIGLGRKNVPRVRKAVRSVRMARSG